MRPALLALVLLSCVPLLPPTNRAHGGVGDRLNFDLAARWGHGPCYAARVSAAGDLVIGSGSVLAVYGLDGTGSSPSRRGELLLPAVVMDLHLEGTTVWVANAKAGISRVDISDPHAPTLVANLELPGTAYACARSGSHLYVACEDGGLRVVDVSLPASPVEVGAFETDLYAMDLVVELPHVFVADMYDTAVKVFDSTDPSAPVLVTTTPVDGPPWGIDLRDGLLAVVDDYANFMLFDASAPTAPVELDTVWLNDVGYDVQLRDGRAYVANDWEGLAVLGLAVPTSVVPLGVLDTPGYAFGVDVVGDRAYVADQHGGTRIVDVASPPALSEVGACEGIGQLRHVHTAGTLSYGVDEWHGLRILQPAHGGGAVLLGSLRMEGSPQRVDVEGSIACVASTTAGVYVVDVSDPRSPVELARIPLPTYPLGSGAMDVSMDGGRVAVVDRYWGFYLFDLTDPTSPVQLGEWGTVAYPRGVVLRGDLAYLADRGGAVRILDLSAVPAITQIAYVNGLSYNFDLDLEGNLLFACKDWRGVWMLDVTNPAAPISLGMLDTPGGAASCSAEYPYLYVADGSRLRAYDITDPTTATQVGEYVCPDFTLGVSAAGRVVHVAGMNAGWTALTNSLLPVDAPPARATVTVLEPNRPNPFNPRTTIRFALAREERARLIVLDARGRTVRVLADEVLAAGPHLRGWDGRDDRGRTVASGVYRYRLETPDRAQTRGMVLLR